MFGVRVRVLGGFSVDGIAEHDLGSRKGRTVLKVLALARGAPVRAGVLAEVLWGDQQPSRPQDQLGVLVSRLRAVLGADRLTRSDAGYALMADWLDVDEVATLAAKAEEALASGKPATARAAAEAALSLARGPILPDEEGSWVEAERAAAEAVVSRARAAAIDAAATAGDHGPAAALGETALARDPYDEVALRAVMRAHLAARRPASALAVYGRVRTRLVEDLGVCPTPETEALYMLALGAEFAAPADPQPPGGSPFVGRASELAVLDRALERAARGETALVVVEGEAGIGKSALVDHWTRRVAALSVAVLRGGCDELGRDLPLQPLGDALAEHLRTVPAERAAAIVGHDSGALAPLLGPAAGPAATVVVDVESGQLTLFSALARAIARTRDTRPVVVAIEDMHLAGRSTAAWLAFARHRCPGVVFLMTTRRPQGAQLGAGTVLRLGPLDVDEVAGLVGSEQAAEMHRRSGGHPLLLLALTGGARDLQEAVALRVNALGPEAAATLHVAAVLGTDCDLDLVAQLRDVPAIDVLTHFEAAAEAGLLAERGAGFAFRHDLVRDALDVATAAARRALFHREAARALAARPEADVLRVAVHASQGGERQLASASYVAAAGLAAARYDVDAAEEYLTTAIQLQETADAHVARARVRMSRRALASAADDAARAVALGGGAPALEVAGWVAYYRRRYDEASAVADQVLELTADAGVRASALALAGRVRHGSGDLEGALRLLTAPADDAPPAIRGVADVWLAHVRNHQGRPEEALAAMARVLPAPDALAHPWAPLHLRYNWATALGHLGRAAEALRAAEELVAATDRAGPVGERFRAPAENIRAWVLRWAGRTAEADEANLGAVALTGGESGPAADAMAEAYYAAMLDLADGCLLRDDGPAAAALAEQMAPITVWTGTMAWHQRHRYGLLRARLALLDGDAAAAAGLAAEVAGDAAARGAGRYRVLATAVLGLADRAVPAEQLDWVVRDIGSCAGLDGWPLVAALAAERRVDAWASEADSLIARVVASAGERGDDLLRLAARVTGSRPGSR